MIADVLNGASNTGTALAVYAEEPADYQVVMSSELAFGDGGYGGWSCPAGTVVLGGGFEATGPVSVSAPGTPGSVWPHYTFGSDEHGWVVQDALDGANNTITVWAVCAAAPAGYEVVSSSELAFGDGGYAGWSCPAGTAVTGGGFASTGTVSVSAPADADSSWPHYTFGADEYGWVVQDDLDGAGNDATVYAVCASM